MGHAGGVSIGDEDLIHLRRCVVLAREALDAGDEPFGSLLVGAEGDVLREERNGVGGGDETRHPELALARWAARHLTAPERASATVYTSGEHCAMCAAAHGWVGLGRIVYAVVGAAAHPVAHRVGRPAEPGGPLAIRDVVPAATVDGPADVLVEEMEALHRACVERQARPA